MLLGVLGGGQLGRMLGLAAVPLGVRCRFWEPDEDAPAAAAGEHVRGPYDDPSALANFAHGLTACSYEFENVPVDTAEELARRLPVFPPPAALRVAQERLAEKTFFANLGIATPPFFPVETRTQFDDALPRVGCPAVVKTRRFGYDGKGQWLVREPHEADAVWLALNGRSALVEAFVPFDRELSIVSVRGRDGDMRFYPLVRNIHEGGILRRSFAPAEVDPQMQLAAERIARSAMEALNYVGVLAIELFDVNGQLLVNEMAPRVHNSGHWTIEGAVTSQFENHVRAVMGLPLGDTSARGCSAMINLIGELPDASKVLSVPGAHLHLYGKEPRPGRKVGHITICAESDASLQAKLQKLPLGPQ